jgi:hypothetical protein
MSIRIFLARAVPWPTEAMPGFVNIHWINRNDETRVGHGLPGRAHTDHGAAAGFVTGMLKAKTDLYVCMSLQARAEPFTLNERGKQVRKASRHSEDAVALRSFWVDVDVKPGFFDTTVAAKLAFDQWRTTIGLPEPTFIVLTGGGGFHAHWILDDPISRETWLPLAHALQHALKTHQFPCDYSVVIDAARVLRIPGTINYKDPANPRPAILDQALGHTYPLALIADKLEPYKVAYASRVTVVAPVGRLPPGMVISPKLAGLPAGPRLDAGIVPVLPTLEEVIAGGCGWLEELKANEGALASEPEWFESIKCCTFIAEGGDVAHELSRGHPDYDEAGTDLKYAQAAGTHGGGRYGWPQCRTINAAGATACTRCPHLIEDRSPLNFALPAFTPAPPPPRPSAGPVSSPPVAAAPLWLPQHHLPNMGFGDLPASGYKYTSDGCIHAETEKEGADGKPYMDWVPVLPMPIYKLEPYRKSVDGGGNYGTTFLVQTDDTHLDRVLLRLEDMSDNRKLIQVCGAQGVTVREPNLLRDLIMSFREQLWSRKTTAPDSQGFGWSIDKGQAEPSGFCYGNLRYTAAGTQPFIPVEAKVAEKYQPCGTLDHWKAAALLITEQQRPDLIAIICTALAAPLTYWTGHAGIVLSAYSLASGIGKSHAMRVGQAFWGSPSIGMGGLDDTAGYVGARVSLLRHLPFFFDELRQEDDIKKLVTMIFAMGQGKSKGRLTPSAEAREVYEFSTMMAVASNNSLLAYINDHVKTTTAGINRIFELPVKTVKHGPGMIDPTEAQRINGGLNSNYGHPGAVYAAWLGTNVEKVKADVAAMASKINTTVGATHDERFWVSTIAVLVLGAVYGNQLSLTKINIDALVGYLLTQFTANRLYRTGSSVDIDQGDNVVRYLEEYINARRDSTLITDTAWDQPQRPAANFKVLILNHENRFDRKLTIRVGKDNAVLRVSTADFGKWLKDEKGVARDVIIDKLLKVAGGRKVKTAIGAHTKFTSAREEALQFDLNNLPGLIFD